MLSPIKFQPILKQTPWGGERIIPFKHLDRHDGHVGESWEVSDVPGSVSTVSEGPLSGQTLDELIATYGARLLGEKVVKKHGNSFPLLIKFIDAKQDLSIQVHPDDALARKRGAQNGKTEMWYVVSAGHGASLLSGFTRNITKDEYRTRASAGNLCDVISRHSVKAGDCFFIPAGRVHAICSDIFLIEIQQSSDVTYRIYDYGRMGLDGRPRQLHIMEAEDAIDFHAEEDAKTTPAITPNTRNEVVRCPYFITSVYQLSLPVSLPIKAWDSFSILIAYQGAFMLTTMAGQMHVNVGDTVLLPALLPDADITPLTPECAFLEVHV